MSDNNGLSGLSKVGIPTLDDAGHLGALDFGGGNVFVFRWVGQQQTGGDETYWDMRSTAPVPHDALLVLGLVLTVDNTGVTRDGVVPVFRWSVATQQLPAIVAGLRQAFSADEIKPRPDRVDNLLPLPSVKASA